MSYEYNQVLRYLYFEGYANSYEQAEQIVEELNEDELYSLCESVFSSKSSGAVSAGAAEQAAKTHKTVADAPGTPKRMRKAHRDAAARELVTSRRMRRSSTNEEFVIDYLVNEGYADNYYGALGIYESMSDEWLLDLLEVKGGGKVTRQNYRERGMKYSPDMKLHMKKAQLDHRIETGENRIRANTGANNGGGYGDDDEYPDDRHRPTASQRRAQARKNRFADEVIRTSPRLNKLKKRHNDLDRVERSTNWNS